MRFSASAIGVVTGSDMQVVYDQGSNARLIVLLLGNHAHRPVQICCCGKTEDQHTRHLKPAPANLLYEMADFITNLPLEVIQQIASLCSLRDVVSLSWTCRKLRPLCHDHFVLQWCFLNQVSRRTGNAWQYPLHLTFF